MIAVHSTAIDRLRRVPYAREAYAAPTNDRRFSWLSQNEPINLRQTGWLAGHAAMEQHVANESHAFSGGYLNRGRVSRLGDYVLREQDHTWPRAVSAALQELARRQYSRSPTVVTQPSPSTVLLTYIPGLALTDPVPTWAEEKAVLLQVTDLLRELSSMSAGMRQAVPYDDWLIPPESEGDVFVHGDPHPTNIIFDEGRKPIGIVDFELATVGTHDWNLASLLFTWVPLEPTELTCWRQSVDLSPSGRISAIVSHWPPESTISDFLLTAKLYVDWRKKVFQALARTGNAAAKEFIANPRFLQRHAHAVELLIAALSQRTLRRNRSSRLNRSETDTH